MFGKYAIKKTQKRVYILRSLEGFTYMDKDVKPDATGLSDEERKQLEALFDSPVGKPSFDSESEGKNKAKKKGGKGGVIVAVVLSLLVILVAAAAVVYFVVL